jgi:hypothetical protein
MANPNWKKGASGNPAGKPKGTKSASTEAIKQYYLELLNGNLANIQIWLTQTASTDPAKALDFLLKLSPFVIPKKQETDITIDNPLQIIIPPKDNKND